MMNLLYAQSMQSKYVSIQQNHIQPECVVKNEQADAGQGDRARLARLNSQARRGIGKNVCIPFQLTTSRIGNDTQLSHTLLKTLIIPTYIRTVKNGVNAIKANAPGRLGYLFLIKKRPRYVANAPGRSFSLFFKR